MRGGRPPWPLRAGIGPFASQARKLAAAVEPVDADPSPSVRIIKRKTRMRP